ncbi:MAG: hypothetical protein HKN02_02770 [Rhodobacteraceae bacterium]|nr:hypothetical protein [Paracoccaceae bacterium]
MTIPGSGTVLIIGSGPNSIECRDWPREGFDHVLAINNAWRVRPDWSHAIFPEDFPVERQPVAGPGQVVLTHEEYVPLQNALGGFVYAGGTMAFTAGYWALAALRPRIMAFIGCDMVYPATGQTHFYGTGTADPLRPDVTLQSLEAKSARLALLAGRAGCACLNLSRDDSRLVFARATPETLRDVAEGQPMPGEGDLAAVLAREAALGYFVPSGRYWEEAGRFDAAALARLDADWLAVHGRVFDAPRKARRA